MGKTKIGIIGSEGVVGGSLKRYFQKQKNFELFFYDKGKKIGSIEEVSKADYIYVCVPTPTINDNGVGRHCDTSIVREVIKQIQGENKIIIIKSTITPRTTETIQEELPNHKILFNPEFLTAETPDQDISYPDRQIVGFTKKSYDVAGEIMLQLPLAPFEMIMPVTEAEMVKYVSNCWLSTKVIFANQIYEVCQKLGIDYNRVKDATVADKRICKSHLDIFHGGYRGFGGYCLPKDLEAYIGFAKTLGFEDKLLKIVKEINDGLISQNK